MANEAITADHLRTTLRERGQATLNISPVKRPPKFSVVYFVQAETGQIKIGTTGYLAGRLEILQGQCPVMLTLLATVPGARIEERAYHAQFAAHRLHGEWFGPHPDILAEIARLNEAETGPEHRHFPPQVSRRLGCGV